MPPGAWPRAARPGADRFFQPFGDIWQLLKEAAAPAAFHPPPPEPSAAPKRLPTSSRGCAGAGDPRGAELSPGGARQGALLVQAARGWKAGSDPNRGWQNPKTPGRALGLFWGLHIPA